MGYVHHIITKLKLIKEQKFPFLRKETLYFFDNIFLVQKYRKIEEYFFELFERLFLDTKFHAFLKNGARVGKFSLLFIKNVFIIIKSHQV